MANKLEGYKVAILLTDGFEQEEMTRPRKALDKAGAITHLIAPSDDVVEGWDHTDWGDTFDVDVQLEEANPADYDALLVPGGVLNPDTLRTNEGAVAFARSFFDEGKPVAAICHGPQLLIEAGVLRGRRMTSYHSVKTDMQNAGADWVNEEVVIDDNFVTSRNPDDIPAFNDAMVRVFAETREAAPSA